MRSLLTFAAVAALSLGVVGFSTGQAKAQVLVQTSYGPVVTVPSYQYNYAVTPLGYQYNYYVTPGYVPAYSSYSNPILVPPYIPSSAWYGNSYAPAVRRYYGWGGPRRWR